MGRGALTSPLLRSLLDLYRPMDQGGLEGGTAEQEFEVKVELGELGGAAGAGAEAAVQLGRVSSGAPAGVDAGGKAAAAAAGAAEAVAGGGAGGTDGSRRKVLAGVGLVRLYNWTGRESTTHSHYKHSRNIHRPWQRWPAARSCTQAATASRHPPPPSPAQKHTAQPLRPSAGRGPGGAGNVWQQSHNSIIAAPPDLTRIRRGSKPGATRRFWLDHRAHFSWPVLTGAAAQPSKWPRHLLLAGACGLPEGAPTLPAAGPVPVEGPDFPCRQQVVQGAWMAGAGAGEAIASGKLAWLQGQ
jgi:hypothetical protein